MKIPKSFGKKRIKKFKRQRANRCFSDYDCWDLDDFLLELIPNAIDHLAAMKHSYSPRLWMYETGEEKDIDADEYSQELKLIASEFRKGAMMMDTFDDYEEGNRIILRCFEWLGHNIGTLWD